MEFNVLKLCLRLITLDYLACLLSRYFSGLVQIIQIIAIIYHFYPNPKKIPLLPQSFFLLFIKLEFVYQPGDGKLGGRIGVG